MERERAEPPSSGVRSSIVAPALVFALTMTAWFVLQSLRGMRESISGYSFLSLVLLDGHEASFFAFESLATFVAAAALATMFTRRWSPALDRSLRGLLERPRAALVAVSILAFAASLFVTLAVTELRTLTEDEKTFIFQAKLLSMGRLSIDVPIEAIAFRQPFVVGAPTHWSGQYFWGQPAVIALASVVHVTWLLSPIELALTTFMTGLLVEELTSDRRASVLASMLCASSPMLVLNAGTLMAVNLAALCGVTSLWAIARLVNRADRRASLVLGVATAMALHTRPFDQLALLLGAASTVVIGARSLRPLLTLLRRAWMGAAIATAFLLLHLPINHAVSGDYRHSGYWMFNEGQGWRTFGFGVGPFGDVSTPAIATAKTLASATRESMFLGGSPLLLAALALASLAGARSRALWAAAPVALVYHVAYFIYVAPPIATAGPVYFVPLAPVLLGWIAIAAIALHDRLAAWQAGTRVVPAALAAHAVAVALLFWPSAVRELRHAVNSGHRCEELIPEGRRALLFTAQGQAPIRTWTHHPPLPSPTFDDEVLYARAAGAPVDAAVAARFGRGREIYYSRCVFEPHPQLEHYDPMTGKHWPLTQAAPAP